MPPTPAPITSSVPTLAPTTFCPVGSTDEGEECRTSRPDTFNGGCSEFGNGVIVGFTNITFGESVCGTVSNYVDNVNRRDSDWYYFKVSEDTTVSVKLTTDFDAQLFLDRLGDVNTCPITAFIAFTSTDVGNNTYEISANVSAGNYDIYVSSQSFGDPSLFCPTPGNYTLTLIKGPIP